MLPPCTFHIPSCPPRAPAVARCASGNALAVATRRVRASLAHGGCQMSPGGMTERAVGSCGA
eukprot:6899080-Alexandrium_andersonii.AAC.1